MKPILFNSEMVRAILDGRKTQTRRAVKPQPPKNALGFNDGNGLGGVFRSDEGSALIIAPYVQGDILYVRETWCKDPGLPPYVYKATCNDGISRKWRPSIHMPKEAARLFLRVTDARVERLRDIDENGAIAEGFYKGWRLCGRGSMALSARQAFMWFWETMTRKAPAAQSWACNPWVWVYTFERISKEEAIT